MQLLADRHLSLVVVLLDLCERNECFTMTYHFPRNFRSSTFLLRLPQILRLAMPSNDSKSPLAQRKIAVSAGMGNTAQAIIELLLVKPKYASLTAIVSEDEVEAFKEQFEGVETLIHKTNEILDLGEIDTLMLIPPSSDVSPLPASPSSPPATQGPI